MADGTRTPILTFEDIRGILGGPLPDEPVSPEEAEEGFERRIDQHFTHERAVYWRKC